VTKRGSLGCLLALDSCDAMPCDASTSLPVAVALEWLTALFADGQDCMVDSDSSVRMRRRTGPKKTCWREVASQPLPNANVTGNVAQ
jgi:hypothetical protein